MPAAKRERRERTDNYHLIKHWCRTLEQGVYEAIRPVVLFGLTTQERAAETSLAESTLRRASDAFDTHGMLSLFRPTKRARDSHHRAVPVMMRQLIVDLKTEYPDFTLGEIAAICAINFDGRRPSHHTVQQVLADGPRPSRTTRQFPRYADIPDPEERRLAIIRLHAQGWSSSRPSLAILRCPVQRSMPPSSAGSQTECGDSPTRPMPTPAKLAFPCQLAI